MMSSFTSCMAFPNGFKFLSNLNVLGDDLKPGEMLFSLTIIFGINTFFASNKLLCAILGGSFYSSSWILVSPTVLLSTLLLPDKIKD